MKTIFIIVTRGFIVRNILRCGVLDLLKKEGCKIIIFIPKFNKEIPNYLKEEFKDKQVVIEGISSPQINRYYKKFYKLFSYFISFLVFTKSTEAYLKIGNANKLKKNSFLSLMEIAIFSFLSKFTFFKKIGRYLEIKLFTFKTYNKYFDKYKPDLVFSTSIISFVDNIFMKEAARRGIKTVSMPKGWDNVTKKLYQFVPDKIILQNEIMKDGVVKVQKINEDKLVVTGFPQFDWYRRNDLIWDRATFFKKIGLNPDRKLLFYGSEGMWAPNDNSVINDLLKMLKNDDFINPVSLYIRPHFSNIKEKKFECFRRIKNVKVDDSIGVSDFFIDSWDPGVEETQFLINAIYYSDIMITVASTLVLDACCFDKPIVTVAYDVLMDRNGNDISSELYKTDHYSAVVKTGAIDMVYNKDELLSSINHNLTEPTHKHEERQKLLNKLCYKVDGKSSERVADEILG